MFKAPLRGRTDDRVGIAVARAEVGFDELGLPVREPETSIEATYQFKISESLAIQARKPIHLQAIGSTRCARWVRAWPAHHFRCGFPSQGARDGSQRSNRSPRRTAAARPAFRQTVVTTRVIGT